MNDSIDSPFSYDRWEKDKDHLIWLPDDFYTWEEPKNLFIFGSRGTGKTTLLKAFGWFERLYNESLKEQVRDSEGLFFKRYIGIYIDALDLPLSDFSKSFEYLEMENDEIEKKISNKTRKNVKLLKERIQHNEEKQLEIAKAFSIYLELVFIQLLINAIRELRSKNYLYFSTDSENEVIKKILEELPEIGAYLETNENLRINDLKFVFKKMGEDVSNSISDKKSTGKQLRSREIGKILREIGIKLLDLCATSGKDLIHNNTWTLKICIDQVESFEVWQQKIVNTLIAKNISNISFIIASNSEYIEKDLTFIRNHSLSADDRLIYNIDSQYEDHPKKFKKLIQGVVKLRIERYCKKRGFPCDNPDFNLIKILGNFTINDQLDLVIQETQQSDALAFRQKVIEFRPIWNKIFHKNKNKLLKIDITFNEETDEINYDDSSDTLPYTEYYLIEKLNLQLPSENDIEQIYKLLSAYLNKKKIAAMLCICSEYKQQIPFSGYKMIMMLSDNCIRDFLRQMKHIFASLSESQQKNFVNIQIKSDNQKAAILKASKEKYDKIKTTSTYSQTETENLIKTLGLITSGLQISCKTQSPLVNPEKGIFYLNYAPIINTADYYRLLELINSAKNNYFILVKEQKSNKAGLIQFQKIRLHRLFSPVFKFSYRGAYHDVPIDPKILVEICTSKDLEYHSYARSTIMKKILEVKVKEPSKFRTLDQWE
jgi:hypothetical protein